MFTDYALGDIPALTALHGGAVVFTIHSEELGPGATFTFQFDSSTPMPLGQLLLDAATGRFSYIPAATDKLPFNILITATKNGVTEQQLARRCLRPTRRAIVCVDIAVAAARPLAP